MLDKMIESPIYFEVDECFFFAEMIHSKFQTVTNRNIFLQKSVFYFVHSFYAMNQSIKLNIYEI